MPALRPTPAPLPPSYLTAPPVLAGMATAYTVGPLTSAGAFWLLVGLVVAFGGRLADGLAARRVREYLGADSGSTLALIMGLSALAVSLVGAVRRLDEIDGLCLLVGVATAVASGVWLQGDRQRGRPAIQAERGWRLMAVHLANACWAVALVAFLIEPETLYLLILLYPLFVGALWRQVWSDRWDLLSARLAATYGVFTLLVLGALLGGFLWHAALHLFT